MNNYNIIWGAIYPSGMRGDGYSTIHGKTFEEARDKMFQEFKKEGIKLTLCEQIQMPRLIDLNTGEEYK
jgi:hypothetical protein